MGRFASVAAVACVALGCLFSASCGSSNPTTVLKNQVPGSITLTPTPDVSLELGNTQALTATARNGAGVTITETFSYVSSNPAAVTVANNGVACAGTWNSLTAPTVCSPGATGAAQVMAVAQGVSSPPVTVYVHQHVTNVVVKPVANQPPTLSNLCLTRRAPNGNPESTLYQAFAFAGNIDVTNAVGPFTWQSVEATGQTASAVTLATPPAGTQQCLAGPQGNCLNMESATANTPGASFIFASVDGVNSQPLQFTTCPVQSISISSIGNPTTSFVVSSGSSTTLNATVTDILGMTITGVPLTWNSSNPAVVKPVGATSSVFGSVGTVTASAPGAGAVTASCTPPTCNGGISPSLPIYPTQATTFTVTPGSSTTSNPTVFVTSTGCSPANNPTNQFCTTRAVPITRTSTGGNTGAFTPGTPVNLLFPPDSLMFDPQGVNAYLGVDSLAFGTQGAMTFSGSTVSKIPNVAGKVLATSPDGTVAIFADNSDTPNRVFVCQSCTSATPTVSTFLMNGATAAAFSIDDITNVPNAGSGAVSSSGGYKAYVVSGQPCPGFAAPGCLLVFSKVDAAKIVPLNAAASDVAFIGDGTLGYIAGGDSAGTASLPTCDDPAAAGSITGFVLPSLFIRTLPDGQSVLALNPPLLQSVTATIAPSVSGPAAVGIPGCPAPRGLLNITNTVNPALNIGLSSFTPTQFFLSSDGSTAYILGETGSGTSTTRLPFIIAVSLQTSAVNNISLAGNVTPLSASLSPAGDLLFVGASDGNIHVINTATQLDTQQVVLPFPQNSICVGPGTPPTQAPVTCNPDIVVVKP